MDPGRLAQLSSGHLPVQVVSGGYTVNVNFGNMVRGVWFISYTVSCDFRLIYFKNQRVIRRLSGDDQLELGIFASFECRQVT